tara:strand:- start:4198 stop:4668 length:471 start_codon:yes stop_codon:yes gene_type:complete
MLAGVFIFKPQHPQIAEKIIENFTSKWLSWDECSAYSRMISKDCPDGYYRVEIEVEGIAQEYTEACWQNAPLTASDLADDMFIVLHEQGFFECDEEGEPIFSFEDRELCEVITALAENSSRIISPWMDNVWIADKDKDGTVKTRAASTLNYLLESA